MSEMVDRVAQALYVSDPCKRSDFSRAWRGVDVPVAWEEAGATVHLRVTGYARAAIDAFRVPSSSMVIAGEVHLDLFKDPAVLRRLGRRRSG